MLKNETYLKKLGKNINKLAVKKYASKNAFAKAAELDARSIGRIINGEQNLTIIALRKISKALDTELHDLVNIK